MTSELPRFIAMARLARAPQGAILIAAPAQPALPPPAAPTSFIDRLRRLSTANPSIRPVELA